MKKNTIFIFLFLLVANVFAQEEEAKKENLPVRPPFESGMLLNSETTVIPVANTLEFMIQHRFGKLDNDGAGFDMFGLYAPSNIRLGLAYSIMDRVRLGIGSTKNQKLFDGNIKVKLFDQTKSNSMPVGIVYHGNFAFSARAKENFEKTTHRFSYFHELMVSRRISYKFSLQLSGSFSHFNVVDSLMAHDVIGVGLVGRVKVSPQMSVIFEYDQHITNHDPEFTKFEVKSNIGLGIEVATSAHSFQIFISSFDAIMGQHNYVYNTNDFTKGAQGLVLGFNINRLWNF